MAGLFNPSSHDAREMIRGIISQTFALRITTYLLNGTDVGNITYRYIV